MEMETKLLKIVKSYLSFIDYEHIWRGRWNSDHEPIVTWQGKDHVITYVLEMMNVDIEDIRQNHEESEHSRPDPDSDH